MTNAQKIKMALAYRNISESELARRLGTTPQAFKIFSVAAGWQNFSFQMVQKFEYVPEIGEKEG